MHRKILLAKMTCLGFKTSVIKWFESCLSNKQFFVSVADLFSKAGIANRDVPHSSILGPLLFLTYINDLPQLLSENGSYLYADDTYIFYQDKGVHKIEDVVHKESSKLCQWFVDDRLSIHFGKEKTKCILFSKSRCSRTLSASLRL